MSSRVLQPTMILAERSAPPYAAEGRMAATEQAHRAGGETAIKGSVRSTSIHLPTARIGREAGSYYKSDKTPLPGGNAALRQGRHGLRGVCGDERARPGAEGIRRCGMNVGIRSSTTLSSR